MSETGDVRCVLRLTILGQAAECDMQVNIYEAKTQLSQLVEAAHGGETIIIAKAGTPMAKLVPLGESKKPKIRFGGMKGQFVIPDDFDGPLPDDLQAAFEGRMPD